MSCSPGSGSAVEARSTTPIPMRGGGREAAGTRRARLKTTSYRESGAATTPTECVPQSNATTLTAIHRVIRRVGQTLSGAARLGEATQERNSALRKL